MRKISARDKALALKWAKGQVSHAYVGRTLKKTSVGTYVALALILREVVKEWD